MVAAAAGTVYPLVAEVNLTRNTYRIISYSSFVNKTAAIDGTLDDFIEVGVSTLPDKEEAEAFSSFSAGRTRLMLFGEVKKNYSLSTVKLVMTGSFTGWIPG